jgi:hypothetical protein
MKKKISLIKLSANELKVINAGVQPITCVCLCSYDPNGYNFHQNSATNNLASENPMSSKLN